jgi:xanthosine utilization system XapX-like protein
MNKYLMVSVGFIFGFIFAFSNFFKVAYPFLACVGVCIFLVSSHFEHRNMDNKQSSPHPQP